MWRSITWTSFERAVKLALGCALTWHQAAIASEFNPYVFTGGLTLLGATEAVRWDLARRNGPVSSTSSPPPSPSSQPAPP